MFYEPRDNDHGLPHNPFKACVAPRPIGWISTISKDGAVNLAPYSFFNAVSDQPPVILYSSNEKPADAKYPGDKDTLTNIRDTGEFVVNVATWDLRDQVNQSSAPLAPNASEFDHANLTESPSTLIKPPRLAESPINMECQFIKTVTLPCRDVDSTNVVVFGEVIGIHIDESVLTDGLVDVAKVKPISRLGYMDYAVTDSVFTMTRPT